jgi:hypothetical protein
MCVGVRPYPTSNSRVVSESFIPDVFLQIPDGGLLCASVPDYSRHVTRSGSLVGGYYERFHFLFLIPTLRYFVLADCLFVRNILLLAMGYYMT